MLRAYVIGAKISAERAQRDDDTVHSGGVADMEGALRAVMARGLLPIPVSKVSPAEAARMYHSALGHVSGDTLRGIIDASSGLSEAHKDKIKKGIGW
jgi:hypothetical protein